MLLLLRKHKHGHFMNKKFRKYLLYAVGEMGLVIVGILIALQIDNWNTERQQEALLNSYLQTITGNMRDDARALERLRATRSARTFDAMRAALFMGRFEVTFDVAEIFFFNKVTREAVQNLRFKSDTSGYEALKNSGVMYRLQGRDIGRLLSRYYEQVSHIEDLEAQLNGMLNTLNLQFVNSFPDSIPQWQFWAPRALPPDLFQELQPEFARIINGPAVREIVNQQIGASYLVREYDRLGMLGDAFASMVESGSMVFDDRVPVSVLDSDRWDESAHYAELVVDGQLSTQFYHIAGVADGFDPTVFGFRSIAKVDDALRIDYPGSDSWAAIFTQVLDIDEDRPVLDYSQFDELVLELRAESGEASLSVHIKDRFLPDSESPESVEIQLADEWRTYEIDLAKFPKTDLSKLITPLGFGFIEKPQSFLLRSARYVAND